MKITVTQEDISHGIAKDCEECPIAHALERALGCRSYVERDSFFYRKDGRFTANLPLPEIASAFIAAFDAGQPVEPFSFEVEV